MLRQTLNFLPSAFGQFFPELKIFAIAVKKRYFDVSRIIQKLSKDSKIRVHFHCLLFSSRRHA